MSTTGEEKRSDSWLLTALAAPLAQTASGCSWAAVLGTGTVCLCLCWAAEGMRRRDPSGKLFSGMQWLWLIFVMGAALKWTAECWQDGQGSAVIGATLLLLAAWTASKGSSVSSRAGNLLRFFLAVLIGGVLLSGLGDIRLTNLRPQWRMNSAHIVTLFLFPAAAAWGTGGKSGGKSKLAILLFAVCTAAVTSGVLSAGYAARQASAFYELSRSAELLGTARRFESLAALGMTLGYYVFLTFLLDLSGAWAERAVPGKRNLGIWLGAAGGMLMLLTGTLNDRYLAVGSVGVWIILPVIAGLLGKRHPGGRTEDAN